ncbi:MULTISPECIES: hypothetical protein [Clostridium]|uniref:hypothetical protein n=1 Tax=Clostridium TaxID=1485 RepID=UPI0003F96890|nr:MULTISPECIES: hypothetical protein [Clostridium]MBO1685481.1 hypothetical protein [Clostridium butyricum]MDU3581891.1 hypothetical protein [Clostridium butyricum]MDU3594635.1 hypothetical protein [Clostridium butyricum]DAL62003.1 MAG TPA_asm: hypothetical protein [Caudoviricetes sp.]
MINIKFDSAESEKEYMKLYSEFGYFHTNYVCNHIIPMKDVKSAKELLKYFDE